MYPASKLWEFILPCGFPERLVSISNGIGFGKLIRQRGKDWEPGLDKSFIVFLSKSISFDWKVNTAETKSEKNLGEKCKRTLRTQIETNV